MPISKVPKIVVINNQQGHFGGECCRRQPLLNLVANQISFLKQQENKMLHPI